MKRRLPSVFAFALLCCGVSSVAADRPEPWLRAAEIAEPAVPAPLDWLAPANPDLSLVWFDPQNSLANGFETVAGEVQAIFQGLGIKVAWRRGTLGTTFGNAPVPETAVILLSDDPARQRQGRRVMGLVVPKQEPTRSIWVFLANVRWTLGLPARPKKTPSLEEARAVGLALGRVVAHEVVHAIVPDEPHANTGLMEHALGKGYLLGKEVSIDPGCARALLLSLAGGKREGRVY